MLQLALNKLIGNMNMRKLTEKQKAYRKELRKLSGSDFSVFIDTFHLKYVIKKRSFADSMNSAKSAVFDNRK
jgi:hypothetical protein